VTFVEEKLRKCYGIQVTGWKGTNIPIIHNKKCMCRAVHEIILDVGFNFQQLPVPPETDPKLTSIMARCWCRDPASRCKAVLSLLASVPFDFIGVILVNLV
jgi:hypothetical protein